MEQLGREKNLAYWSCPLPFYGPAKVVDAAVGIREGEIFGDPRRDI